MSIRIFYIIILFFVSCSGYKEKTSERTYFANGNIKEEITKITAENYSINKYHENGKLEFSGILKNELLNGMATIYYSSGGLKEKLEYDKGILCGKRELYNENENLEQVIYYFNGENYYSKLYGQNDTLEALIPIIEKDTSELYSNTDQCAFTIMVPFVDSLELPFLNDEVVGYFKLSKNDDSTDIELNDSTETKIILDRSKNSSSIVLECKFDTSQVYLKGLVFYESNIKNLSYHSIQIN